MTKLIVLAMRTDQAKRFDLPEVAKKGDCGFDLKCTLVEPEYPNNRIDIPPNQYRDIPTGIKVKLPNSYFAIIMPRSSVFTQKQGLRIHEGIIDNGFTGELKILAINQTDETIVIEDGERLAQLILFPLIGGVEFVEVEELPPTTRGEDGFGSTGR